MQALSPPHLFSTPLVPGTALMHLTDFPSFYPHSKYVGLVLLLAPFYQWDIRTSSEMAVRIQTQVCHQILTIHYVLQKKSPQFFLITFHIWRNSSLTLKLCMNDDYSHWSFRVSFLQITSESYLWLLCRRFKLCSWSKHPKQGQYFF